jgi:hypothetical protein
VATVSDAAALKGALQAVAHGNVNVTATSGTVVGTLALRVRAKNAPASTQCGPGLVISQVFGGGGGTGAPYRNDYVELHNAGVTAVSLAGMSVQYASTSGTSWGVRTIGNATIQPGDYYLIQLNTNGTTAPAITPDFATSNMDIAQSNGKLALVSDATPLTGSCPLGGTVLDFVGYGTANCSEGGSAVPALSPTTAAFRQVAGCRDTQANLADFTTAAPAPRSLAAPGVLCDCNVTGTVGTFAADYCALQFPSSLGPVAGAKTDVVYTRLFETGVTEAAGAATGVRAEVGYGASASDPTTATGWSWWPTTFNVQVGNDDEYQGAFVAPAAGPWLYTGRVSFDGVNWTYCDLNGAGSNGGLSFETTQLGVMTVAP